MKNKTIATMALLTAVLLLASCHLRDNVLPKPRGYFRIDLPDTGYVVLDSLERYRFEYPQYAVITNDPYSPQEKNWINVEMPVFKASIHITHKNIEGNLGQYLDDVHTMVTKHLQKANGMRDSLIVNDKHLTLPNLINLTRNNLSYAILVFIIERIMLQFQYL